MKKLFFILVSFAVPAQAGITVECKDVTQSEGKFMSIILHPQRNDRLEGSFFMPYNGANLTCSTDAGISVSSIVCVGLLDYPKFESMKVILSIAGVQGKGVVQGSSYLKEYFEDELIVACTVEEENECDNWFVKPLPCGK